MRQNYLDICEYIRIFKVATLSQICHSTHTRIKRPLSVATENQSQSIAIDFDVERHVVLYSCSRSGRKKRVSRHTRPVHSRPTPRSLLPSPNHVCRACPSRPKLTKQRGGFWPIATAEQRRTDWAKSWLWSIPNFRPAEPTARVRYESVCVDPSQPIHPRILTSQGDPTASSDLP